MTLIHDPITFVLICLVCHFFADFNLQLGAHLGDFKCKSWWMKLFDVSECDVEERTSSRYKKYRMYRQDYLAALSIHAFVWSGITFLPYLVIGHYTPWKMLFTVIANTAIHAWVDHLKCNKYSLNLVQDQLIHFLQVVGFSLILWYI